MKELVAGQNGCNARGHHLWRVDLVPTERLRVLEENTDVENVEWHKVVVERGEEIKGESRGRYMHTKADAQSGATGASS